MGRRLWKLALIFVLVSTGAFAFYAPHQPTPAEQKAITKYAATMNKVLDQFRSPDWDEKVDTTIAHPTVSTFGDRPMDIDELLQRTFEEVAGYDEMVLMRDIHFVSHCEHHMAPIAGRVHIGYLPRNRVVGISKLARLVQAYANRLQIQERLTAEIANTLHRVLGPHGVGVVVVGTHGCMTSRGVHQSQATMVTSRMLGAFRDRPETRQEFLAAIGLRGATGSGNAAY